MKEEYARLAEAVTRQRRSQWESVLDSTCRDVATEQDKPWNRRVRLVVGNFTRCPQSRSDMWGKAGSELDPFGQRKAIYVNYRVIRDAIPTRLLVQVKLAIGHTSPLEQIEAMKVVIQKLDRWFQSWLNTVLASRIVKFGLHLQCVDPKHRFAEGKNVFDTIDEPRVTMLSRAHRKLEEKGA